MKLTKQCKSINEQSTDRRSLAMRIKQFAFISLALAATSLPVTTWSGNLILSNSPLFLRNAVQPNIFFMLDDSGSMGWEILHFDGDRYSVYGYDDHDQLVYDSASLTTASRHELCRGYNLMAYNPNAQYTPWFGKDDAGVVYGPAYVSDTAPNFTAVRNNPYLATGGTTNLNTDVDYAYFPFTDGDGDGVYDVGECGANIATDNSDGVTFASMTLDQKKNFANWYSYYRQRDFVMKAALTEVIYGSDSRVGMGTLWNNDNVGVEIKDIDNFSVPINATADAAKATLLDKIGQIRPSGRTPLRQKLEDVGQYYDGSGNAALFGTTRNHTGTVSSNSPILNAANGGECQQNFAILMTDGFWNQGNPAVGNTDANTASPFDGGVYADTYSNTLADVAMHYYKNDLAGSLANLVPTIAGVDENDAQHMVTYTVAFGLKGEIRDTFAGDPGDAGWPGWPDPFSGNTDKTRIDDVWHAAFNGRGLFLDAGNPQELISSFNEAINDISSRTGSAAGVSVTSGTISSSTRIYQTKFNSNNWYGHLLNFRIDETTRAILPANDFSGGSTNDAILAIEAQDWNLGRTILSHNGSQGIAFRWPSSPGSPGADEMSPSQVTAMVDGAVTGGGLPDYALASQRVDYLRGDHTNEFINGGTLRTRNRDVLGCTVPPCAKVPFVLGDSVHSSPLYVGPPAFAYPNYLEAAGAEYYKHRLTYFDRTPMVFFGANDGMLHGINVTPPDPVTGPDPDSGKEIIAYVPSRVYNKLPALTNRNYNHQYYVDESPEAGDVFYGGAWHTVLLGALRSGGQSIFALDITDPTTFSEDPAAAQNTVLWEFTDADDADLGYTHGRPSIAKMADDKWYAIIGNGYNNTEADGSASTTGNAVLFLIEIETGAITKIDTGIGMAQSADTTTPNGLARPALVDADNDYIIDYIYAGDLQGNIHKFDVTGTKANWTNASSRSILFTATDAGGVPQPITSRPEIIRAPAGPKGLMVIFGTGKYIEPSDITSTQNQSMYGIWDQAGYSGTATVNVTRSELVTQTLTYTVGPTSGIELRLDTNNPITTWGNGGGADEYMGWKIDLPETGERVIANPLIQDNVVVFISITPSDSACEPGGTSWFMAFRASNGGRTDSDVIDVNEDFDTNDQDRDGGADVVSGVRKGNIILNTEYGTGVNPNTGSTVEEKCASAASSTVFTSDSTGKIGGTNLSLPQDSFRQGWRQIQ